MADTEVVDVPQQALSANGDDVNTLTITLKIIQQPPAAPLIYRDLPAEGTTVQQLKDRIRGDIEVGDQNLRLIYQGRQWDHDENTLLNVLGESRIRESPELACHLVLTRPRDVPTGNTNATRILRLPQRPQRPSSQPPPQNRSPPPDSHIGPALAAHRQNQARARAPAHAPAQMDDAEWAQFTAQVQEQAAQVDEMFRNLDRQSPMDQYVQQQRQHFLQQQQHIHQQQQHIQQQRAQRQQAREHQAAQQHRNSLQRDALRAAQEAAHREAFRHQIGQNQRDRASAGLRGVQDRPAHAPGLSQRTFVREHVGPDGQSWRVTVSESTTAIVTDATPAARNASSGNHAAHAPGSRSAFDVQNGLRTPDVLHNQAIQTWTNAFNQGLSRAGSRTATPEPDRQASTANAPRARPANAGHEVYILTSPTGPQALLIHNTHGTYATPGARPSVTQHPLVPLSQGQFPLPQLPVPMRVPLGTTPPVLQPPTAPAVPNGQDIVQQWLQPPQQQQPVAAPAAPAAALGAQQPNAPGQQQNQPAPAAAQPQVRPLHGNIANAGLAANIGQHIWLLVRVGLLIWWLTGPNTSWTRWAVMIAVGVAILIVSSGLLDGPANQAWQPIRRHIEGLLPRGLPANPPNQPAPPAAANAVPDNADPAAAAAAEGAAAPGPARDPDPREIAARLVAGRQAANANWLMTQLRRVERAGILFLASIVPGLAEGHVQMFEAEAREERRRVEEEEAAAVAAREAEAAATAAGHAANGPAEGSGENGQEVAGDHGDEAQPIPETATGDGAPDATSSGVEGHDAPRRRMVGAEAGQDA